MAVILADDFTGTNGNPWDTAKWSKDNTGSGADTIQSNRGRMYTSSGSTAWENRVRVIGIDSTHTSADVLVEGFRNTGASQGRYWELFLRGSGDWVGTNLVYPSNSYRVAVSVPQDQITLHRHEGGVETELVGPTPLSVSGGQIWSLRFRIVDDQIKVRWWQGTEPGTWNWEITDATNASGVLQVCQSRFGTNTSAGGMEIDAITLDSLVTVGDETHSSDLVLSPAGFGPPQNIQYVRTPTQVDLSWDAVTGADAYDVERDSVVLVRTGDTSYEDSGLTPGTRYEYRVRAVRWS